MVNDYIGHVYIGHTCMPAEKDRGAFLFWLLNERALAAHSVAVAIVFFVAVLVGYLLGRTRLDATFAQRQWFVSLLGELNGNGDVSPNSVRDSPATKKRPKTLSSRRFAWDL